MDLIDFKIATQLRLMAWFGVLKRVSETGGRLVDDVGGYGTKLDNLYCKWIIGDVS